MLQDGFPEYPQSEIGTEDLRSALLDFYGTAMPFFPAAAADLGRIESMSRDELIREAQSLGLLQEDA